MNLAELEAVCVKKGVAAGLTAAAVLTAAFILALVIAVWGLFVPITRQELTGNPAVGVWYRISPEGAVDSTGAPWHGYFRKGSENKVLISFMGGGFSMDADSAAMNDSFYYHHSNHDEYVQPGLADTSKKNPFRDWTVIVITYSTADFHLGTGQLQYENSDGRDAVIHYNGYLNCQAMMDRSMAYVGTPDEVLISGWSAGGFGAAVLADELLDDYFPDTKKSTVLVDSAVLTGSWPEIAGEVWQAPQTVAENLTEGNLTLHSLQRLSADHPETTILYCGSVRDAYLSKYQNYILNGQAYATDESLNVYRQVLRETVDGVLALPNSGVFLWDDKPDDPGTMTGHISLCKRFYKVRINGTTIADWVQDAVNGTVQSFGLEHLNDAEPETGNADNDGMGNDDGIGNDDATEDGDVTAGEDDIG